MKYILITTIIIVLLAICIIFLITLKENSYESYEDKIVENVDFPFKKKNVVKKK